MSGNLALCFMPRS